jgi:outer membrane biogenesis lipoprotein LolB
MRVVIVALASVCLHACSEPAAQRTAERAPDSFMHGQGADERAYKDAQTSASRWEHYERTYEARARYRVAQDQARAERFRSAHP